MSRVRLDRGELPWSPLVPGGEGLNRFPAVPDALRWRMAEVYGVSADCVLPVLGADHGIALLQASFGDEVAIVDERAVELAGTQSRAPQAVCDLGLAVVRDLALAYGLAGAPCGAVIAAAERIATLRAAMPNWAAIPTPTQRLALAALDPSRVLETKARLATLRFERSRLATALGVAAPADNRLMLEGADPASFARLGLAVEWLSATTARVTIGTPHENDLVLAAMGVALPPRAAPRRADVVRDTKETRIVCAVDLDAVQPVALQTGIGFYDHMLEQVAKHGGFSLILAAEGDLHIEAHHTIEDCALALGEALRQALGPREGIARFGFVAPLDEALAQVALDLSGRPLAKFAGSFRRPMIGDYPTEMTPHVFRSIADTLRATIHVTVTGEDDHHKTEAVFKAFGRALRQAFAREGEGVPSTKGLLA